MTDKDFQKIITIFLYDDGLFDGSLVDNLALFQKAFPDHDWFGALGFSAEAQRAMTRRIEEEYVEK